MTDASQTKLARGSLPRRAALLAAVLGGAFAGLSAAPAAAQIALYENRLPDGFAYVRFANTLADGISLKPSFGDTLTMGTDGRLRITPYQVVENVADRTLTADATVSGTATKLSLQLKPGSFHTVLIGRKGTDVTSQVVTDQTEYNQLRARLSFYNAVPDCPAAGLALEPSNQSIFTGVGPLSMRARSVNPVTAKVRVTCGTAKPLQVDLGELGAGGLYSVWMMAPGGTPVTFMAQDAIAPYRR